MDRPRLSRGPGSSITRTLTPESSLPIPEAKTQFSSSSPTTTIAGFLADARAALGSDRP